MVTCATIINMGIFKKVIIFAPHHPFILIYTTHPESTGYLINSTLVVSEVY